MRRAHRAYFDPARPNVTEKVSAAIEQMTADGVRLCTDKNGVPELSTNALALLWHSTASGSEVQWSEPDDWWRALNGMYEVRPVSYGGGEPLPLWMHSIRYRRMKYDRNWPNTIKILQYTEIRELAKYEACYWWLHGMGGIEVPYDQRAAYGRLFLPPYKGPPLTLYRGCTEGEERHASWTTSQTVARQFARWNRIGTKHIVRTHAPAEAIIWDTRGLMRKTSQAEIVVDPAMLGEIKVVEILPPRTPQTLDSPRFYPRMKFRKWGEKLYELDAETPLTASPPEVDRLGRALSQLLHSTGTTTLHEALKVKRMRAAAEQREMLRRAQEMVKDDVPLDEIAAEVGFSPVEVAEFLLDSAENMTSEELVLEIKEWVGD